MMIQDSLATANDLIKSDLPKLLSIGATLLGSLILGLVKAKVINLDKKIVHWVKPFQPIIVAALGVGIGYVVTTFTSLTPADANLVAGAPLSGLIAVIVRELLVRAKKAGKWHTQDS